LTTLTLPLAQAKSIASLINIAEGAKGIFSVLQSVKVNIADNVLTAVATDRYIAGYGTYLLEDPIEDASFWLDANACKLIKAMKAPKYGHAFVTFEIFADDVLISDGVSSIRSGAPKDNYPDILGLIGGMAEAPEGARSVSLTLSRIAQIDKVIPSIGGLDAWHLTHMDSGREGKPGPVRFMNGNMILVLQPNLIR
jgi:hypothetical protein